MLELLSFISYLLTLYIYVLIAMAVMSWLIAFNVVNPRSPIVHELANFCIGSPTPYYGQFGIYSRISAGSTFRPSF